MVTKEEGTQLLLAFFPIPPPCVLDPSSPHRELLSDPLILY